MGHAPSRGPATRQAMTAPAPVILVLSGGQTGADQGGLLGARDAGVATGGTAPKGWRTQDGPAPWLAGFGLVEGRSAAYAARTRANVEAADGTVLFGAPLSKGSALTARCCLDIGKPLLRLPYDSQRADVEATAERLAEWLRAHEIRILNVAGNRESDDPGLGAYVREVIFRALTLMQEHARR